MLVTRFKGGSFCSPSCLQKLVLATKEIIGVKSLELVPRALVQILKAQRCLDRKAKMELVAGVILVFEQDHITNQVE